MTGHISSEVTVGSLVVTPLLVSILLALGSLVRRGHCSASGGGSGSVRSRPRPAPTTRAASSSRRRRPRKAGSDPGWLLGIPVAWAAICLLAIPLAVYVASYIPWAMIDDHRIIAGWPAGHEGQTLLDLTRQMYGYHNGLTSPHPASSPWWAWPLDLKPVWFYQEGLAGGTAAAIYDAGNLVIWWIGAAAMVFVSVQAYRRRSLALALIAIAFAFQWLSWARIDRAAFQYHYYTSLPFIVLALAYFIAEVWHGASRFTWQFARLAGAVAIVLPAGLWLFSRPLCAIVGVESVNPNSAACPAVIPDFVLTTRTAALALVAGIGLFMLVRTVLAISDADPDDPRGVAHWYRRLAIVGGAVGLGFILASRLGDDPILTLTRIPVEPIVLVAAVPLAYLALGVLAGRDPRRFVVGYIVAAVAWGVILYPNIAALPLPSIIVNAYQGILPTLPVRVPVPGQHRRPDVAHAAVHRSSSRCWR